MRSNYDFAILHNYKYPNLVAEYMETGYHICTLADHMELGRGKEAEELAKQKVLGNEVILASEAFNLARLFNCNLEYLLSGKLEMFGDVPIAYIRHYESNQKQKRDSEMFQLSEDIRHGLKEKPYLADFMRSVLSWTEEQVKQISEILYKPDAA